MTTSDKPSGPAAYFPAIERKYDRPIGEWLEIARGLRGLKHMQIVERLKPEHGMGHGHANSIVAAVLARSPRGARLPSRHRRVSR